MIKLRSDRNRVEKIGTGHEDGRPIIVRDTKFSDIRQLIGIYLSLSDQDRRWFHPFPFQGLALHAIFFLMVSLEKFIPITKALFPGLVFLILVAENPASGQLVGFTYLRGRSFEKKRGRLIANRGIIAVSGTRLKGIGSAMDSQLIGIAKEIGICKFSVTVLKDNVASIRFHEKMGYSYAGTSTEHFNGIEEEIVLLDYVVRP